jgi:hypothetical protein
MGAWRSRSRDAIAVDLRILAGGSFVRLQKICSDDELALIARRLISLQSKGRLDGVLDTDVYVDIIAGIALCGDRLCMAYIRIMLLSMDDDLSGDLSRTWALQAPVALARRKLDLRARLRYLRRPRNLKSR